jgi:hypothetical protein
VSLKEGLLFHHRGLFLCKSRSGLEEIGVLRFVRRRGGLRHVGSDGGFVRLFLLIGLGNRRMMARWAGLGGGRGHGLFVRVMDDELDVDGLSAGAAR